MDRTEDLALDLPPALQLRRLIGSYRITHAIKVAAQLGIPDHLGDTPKSSAELAPLVRADPQALYRLLRVLLSIGIVADAGAGRFTLTPVGRCLRSDSPSGMRSWALCEGADYYQQAWMNLPHSVQTGETAFEHTHGMSFYQYLARHADTGRDFAHAMVDFARLIADALVSGYDFSSVRRVVDVGGNHGRLLQAILQANPALSGVLVDRPAVIEGAAASMRAAGLADRCELVAGDFFESVPAGGDLYILSRILMDYDDERCVRLLQNCRRAMAPHGRVLIIQLLVRHGEVSSDTLFEPVISDLNMLVLTGGRERTEEEYRVLLQRAGFRLGAVIPSPSLVSFIEGIRVPD